MRGIGYLGVSVGSLADIIRRIALASPVLHTNRTVGTKRVSGRDIYQPVFKTVLVAGYFVPKSHISVQVERGDRGVIRTFKKTFDSRDGKTEPGFRQTCRADFLTGCKERSRFTVKYTESPLRSNNRCPCLISFSHLTGKRILRNLLRSDQIIHTPRFFVGDKKLHGTAKVVHGYPRERLGAGTDTFG